MSEDDWQPRQHSRTKSAQSGLSRASSNRSHIARVHRVKKTDEKEKEKTNDQATANFVRRTLCSHHIRPEAANDLNRTSLLAPPLEELLPPLTSSNEIDLQLYALIAIVLKDFVHIWYSKITPDQQFTDKVIQIIAHCTRALEQRLRHIDTEILLLDEIPAIINAHITAYRTVLTDEYSSSLGSDKRGLYHMLHPHPALSPAYRDYEPLNSPEQIENERIWRQLLLQAALSQLLPPEDRDNPCLVALVTDILGELILGNAICGKLSESWFIWETTTKLIEIALPSATVNIQSEIPPAAPSRLEQFGLLSTDDNHDEHEANQSKAGLFDTLSFLFWQMIHYSLIVLLGLRSFVMLLADSSNLPTRSIFTDNLSRNLDDSTENLTQSNEYESKSTVDRPILGMTIWTCCSRFLSIDLRMPWLTATCNLLQWILISGPGMLGGTNSRLDRLISHYVSTTILDPARLPHLLLIIRTNLFPNNTLAQGRPPPTPAEVLEIKQRCASTIANALPLYVRSKLFPLNGSRSVQGEIEEMLDAFGDPYLNKHMLFSLVDLVFSRLFPEIQRERISTLVYGDDAL